MFIDQKNNTHYVMHVLYKGMIAYLCSRYIEYVSLDKIQFVIKIDTLCV